MFAPKGFALPPFLRLVAGIVLLSGGGAAAQQMKPADMSPSTAAARRFPQPVAVGDLLNRTVLRPVESQQILGRVDQVVKTPDGEIDVVVRYGGVFGFGARQIAVPVQAMVVLGEYMEIVDFTPEQLNGFPTYEASKAMPIGPDKIIQVGLARPSH
jgi:hypothetical protein